jgi:hypothetical protein
VSQFLFPPTEYEIRPIFKYRVEKLGRCDHDTISFECSTCRRHPCSSRTARRTPLDARRQSDGSRHWRLRQLGWSNKNQYLQTGELVGRHQHATVWRSPCGAICREYRVSHRRSREQNRQRQSTMRFFSDVFTGYDFQYRQHWCPPLYYRLSTTRYIIYTDKQSNK